MKMDWKISKRVFFISFYLCSLLIVAQQKKEVYFYFDKDSKETYFKYFNRVTSDGRFKGQVKVYQRYGSENKIIDFYIYDLLFVHSKKMEKRIKPIDFLKRHKLLSAEEVKAFMNKVKKENSYLIFQYGLRENEHPIYIVEKKDSSHVILYRVEWRHYEV